MSPLYLISDSGVALTSPPPSLHAEGAANLRAAFDEVRRWWFAQHEEGADPLLISWQYTLLVDKLIQELAGSNSGTAVMALGGYGRREMGPHSDIDLLFLYEGDDLEFMEGYTSKIMYPLWDAGLEAGGATRSIADCEHIMRKDIRAWTSMLDARLVAGDEALAKRLHTLMGRWVGRQGDRRDFVVSKRDEHIKRRAKFADSTYLLQPDIKEGEGGLRDFHTAVWCARATYSGDDFDSIFENSGMSKAHAEELLSSVRFLWRLRHALHLIANKRQDRLTEQYQEEAALMLGFGGSPLRTPAEELSQTYYQHASVVRRRTEATLERVGVVWRGRFARACDAIFTRKVEPGVTVRCGKVLSIGESAIEQDPLLTLRAFVLVRRYGALPDADTKEFLEAAASRVDDSMRNSSEAKKLWCELFSKARGLGAAIRAMHECRCLAAWIPEMIPMVNRITHDGFHLYTVDEHTIQAVEEISQLTTHAGKHAHPVAAEALGMIKRQHVMLLATLLHDVGKGHGGRHEEVGAQLAEVVAGRVGFSEEDAREVGFFVRSHLLMPRLAFRRDIRDEHLIGRFAQTVPTLQVLTMLYVLTFADLKSVGPRVWSAWKERLLIDLYDLTRAYLKHGKHTEVEHARILAKKLASVRRVLGRRKTRDEIEAFVQTMPARYALKTSAPLIATHVEMIDKVCMGERVVCDVRNDFERGASEFSIVTKDAPGLFARVAGIITSNGLNIVDADLYTSKEGWAVDVLCVTDLEQRPVEDAVRWKRVMDEMGRIDEGSSLDTKIEKRLKPRFGRRVRHTEPIVDIDNDVSAQETVVEVHVDDSPGVLYRIAKVLAGENCSIERARISTHIDRVVDVFYIRAVSGEKITSQDHVARLKGALIEELKHEGASS